jgi:hypothetical protein
VSLTCLSATELTALRTAHPDAPSDYVAFLESQGYGELSSGPMLYSSLVRPADIFAGRVPSLPGILPFTDDYAGTSYGFDLSRDWIIVAVDSSDMSISDTAPTFTEFVRLFNETGNA